MSFMPYGSPTHVPLFHFALYVTALKKWLDWFCVKVLERAIIIINKGEGQHEYWSNQ